MDELASHYLFFARHLTTAGNYSKAFDLFLAAFKQCPNTKQVRLGDFRRLLTLYNQALDNAGRVEDIFTNFRRALSVFPDNAYIWNEIGKYLYKFGFYTEAWCHFQKSLKLDSGYVNPEKNLNSVKNFLMERWHFRMLNDKTRNEGYKSALRESIKRYKDSVLDLGTGTGILAMYAYECAPVATTGCDGNAVMTRLAECIMQDNKVEVVLIVNDVSTNMNYRNIGGKRSVLVTEMFDAGLLGEHVLQTLIHAKENLMTVHGRIIPNRAEFFVAGVNCDHLHRKYQLTTKAKQLLKITKMNVHVSGDDTYDCEDLFLYKDLKYITEPESLFKLDFNDINDMKEKLALTEPLAVELKAKENGNVNTVVGWFNLYLTDNITLTTNPRADDRANAWQQAVFHDNLTQSVKENDTVRAEFLLNEGRISMVPNFSHVTRASPEIIRFLNDDAYINMISKCMGMACIYLGQLAQIGAISIIDLCPFPFFGFLMLKRGAQSVTCCAKTVSDKKFFKKVFKANNIPLSKVTILVGNDWTVEESFRDEKYHAIFSHIFELCGDVDIRMKGVVQDLRNAHLIQGGLFLPTKIKMMGQLVNSHWLDITNRLYDENVSNYQMAMHVNKYQVSQNFCIDFTCLEYTPLTEPAVVGKLKCGMRPQVVNVPITNNGQCNAILCWYEIAIMEELGTVTTKNNGFMDGTVFLANPPVPMVAGEIANVLRCVDTDGSFKLMIDVDAT